MKKYLIVLIMCCISTQFVFAQDLIVKHDGAKLNVKVNYVTESIIVYTDPANSHSDKLGKAEVEKIVYKSGRIEPISDKIEVHGKKDWEKIVVTSNPLSVIGLIKKGEIHVKSVHQIHGISNIESKDVEKMKKQAAEMGAHVIVLKGYDARQESIKNNDQVVIAYGYE
ncbi:hypothetical protein ACFP1I_20100 [Dyadobacter subterraneus]|uniref:Uncharacterized protein n=1 Tax=Dyadobacter subterraneus TaxID=2773304 RepID=A0ABR9W5W0_9BACT|nr:hypothetical protein [Dyadobacter subterraneus]MBE9460844.1 hypothetical protein [Dyadobacter subterraneus]